MSKLLLSAICRLSSCSCFRISNASGSSCQFGSRFFRSMWIAPLSASTSRVVISVYCVLFPVTSSFFIYCFFVSSVCFVASFASSQRSSIQNSICPFFVASKNSLYCFKYSNHEETLISSTSHICSTVAPVLRHSLILSRYGATFVAYFDRLPFCAISQHPSYFTIYHICADLSRLQTGASKYYLFFSFPRYSTISTSTRGNLLST